MYLSYWPIVRVLIYLTSEHPVTEPEEQSEHRSGRGLRPNLHVLCKGIDLECQ
jgi:hypothetical protein